MSLTRKPRLPNDTAGILEDNISDDPLNFAAYEELITHFRGKSKLDDARRIYELLLKILPTSVWPIHFDFQAHYLLHR